MSGTVNILDVEISCLPREDLLNQVAEWCEAEEREKPRIVTYVNAHCLNVSRGNTAYRALLQRSHLVYADGISVVWASRLIGGCPLEKITGRDWIDDFCRIAAQKGLRIFILAGETGIAQDAAGVLSAKYPGLQIVGTSSGYLKSDNRQRVVDHIRRAVPHILFVGMGAPLQEEWIHRHAAGIRVPVCWGVGALFDYVAGKEPPVPGWMENLALEWMWRLVVDPIGKWKRYIIGNPLFLFHLLISLVKKSRIKDRINHAR